MQEKEIVRLKREAKTKGGFYVEPEKKLLFAIRIRGLNKVPPKVCASLIERCSSCAADRRFCPPQKTKKILQLLRLRQINNAVFVRVRVECMEWSACMEAGGTTNGEEWDLLTRPCCMPAAR